MRVSQKKCFNTCIVTLCSLFFVLLTRMMSSLYKVELEMFYQFKAEELERLLVIKQISLHSFNQRSGSLKLWITERQLRRIMHRYKHDGKT